MKPSAEEVSDYFEANGVSRSYTIAFSMRCGSTVLSNTLSSLGVGQPTEFFQYPYTSNHYFQSPSERAFLDQFRSLVLSNVKGASFGSKMSHDHRARLDGHLRDSLVGYTSLSDVLPGHKWLFMQRKDTIAQAVSWHVAEFTNQWHLPSKNGEVAHHSIPYDFFSILSKIMMIAGNNASWDAYFSLMNIRPHTIIYENLVSDPRSEIRSIFQYFGLEQDVLDAVLERDGGLKSISQNARSTYQSLKDKFTDDFVRIGEIDDSTRLGPSLERWNDFFLRKKW